MLRTRARRNSGAATVPGIAGDSVRIVISGTILGVQSWSISSWWFGVSGGGLSQANLNAFNSSTGAPVDAGLAVIAGALWSADLLAKEQRSYYYPSGSTSAALVSTGFTLTAAGAGSRQMPPQCALVMSLRSLTPGRSGRGRNYIPMGIGGSNNNGGIGSTPLNTVTTAYAAILTNIAALSLAGFSAQVPIVASFTTGQFHEIVDVIGDSKIDTQRRREDKVLPANTITVAV
jgi:hypothetical protein